jgi:hypothetical protein
LNRRRSFVNSKAQKRRLMICTRYNNQALNRGQAVQLKAGKNSMSLDLSNATAIH